MTPLELTKLEFMQKRLGKMSSEQAFQLALEAEQFAKDCGPMDIAYTQMVQQRMTFENYAALLEKAGL